MTPEPYRLAFRPTTGVDTRELPSSEINHDG
jgi:hypothetical protein